MTEADALLEVFRHPWPEETVALEKAAGRILREAVRADRFYPPMDKVCMDGIAIPFRLWEAGQRAFSVAGVAKAGQSPAVLEPGAGAVEVMTGAACPEGCDTVLPVEMICREGPWAQAGEKEVRRAQHVQLRGADCVPGQALLEPGMRLNPARIAVAASVGKARLAVARLPCVALVATGDELVDVGDAPEPWQLRRSNPHGLRALLEGLAETRLDWVPDQRPALMQTLARHLAEADMLLVSGGVSAGKFDLVPEVLRELGVRQVFHKVAMRPGKPLWFGEAPEGKPVFGLPGNPVSALICARRFVLPLLRAKLGLDPGDGSMNAALDCEVRGLEKLAFFLPARLKSRAAGAAQPDGSLGALPPDFPVAIPHPPNGSGDFAGLAQSDGFLELAAGRGAFPPGASLPFHRWETG